MNSTSFDAAHVKFEIIACTLESWDVRFRIDIEELVDQQGLLRHLRAIKKKIAETSHVHEARMVFDGTVSKTRTDDFVEVVVRIKKVTPEMGNPAVYFKDGIALDGTHYSRMTALLDVFYLDRFERVISSDRVMTAIREAAVASDLIESEVISRTISRVLDTLAPLKAVSIAKGVFPDLGKDAQLEFYFQASSGSEQQDSYYSSRRVNAGDPICRKIPSSTGKNAGRNVVGESLPPRAGLDITITAESGASLSLDGNEVTAAVDGVVVITRAMRKIETPHRVKEIPQSVAIKVNPVLKVQGDRVLDIATSQTVEVTGNLSIGSRILTDCEVYVSGNVEDGTLIQAADSVTVEGSVCGSSISSQSSVTIGENIMDSSVVSAHDGIAIAGDAANSTLVGSTVAARSVSGCNIRAHTGVTLDRIDVDENNLLTTICVGMADFFRQRLRDNEDFLRIAKHNQERIRMLIGKEIFDELNFANIPTMLLRFLARSRIGQTARGRKQTEVIRRLMESVPPTRSLIAQKERENAEVIHRINAESGRENNVIIVREKISASVAVSVDGAEGDLVPVNGPVFVRANANGGLDVTPPEALAA
jgi:hypothetical protein